MSPLIASTLRRVIAGACVLVFAASSLLAQGFSTQSAEEPMPYDADTIALVLARKYLEGGDGARDALHEALDRMGWGVRNEKGDLLRSPPAGTATGLAMRDYEIEELTWNLDALPAIRLINYAQVLAIPFEADDPETLAQDILLSIRQSAESDQPQQRFWARFIVALGRASAANYDLLASEADLIDRENLSGPRWSKDDPILSPSPPPKSTKTKPAANSTKQYETRIQELQAELMAVQKKMSASGNDPAALMAAQQKIVSIMTEIGTVSQRMQMQTMRETGIDVDQLVEAFTGEKVNLSERFLAEWRDQPLSFLQIALIHRVIIADLHAAAEKSAPKNSRNRSAAWTRSRPLPLASIGFQLAQNDSGSFGSQLAGAAGDIWATGWGAYTSKVIDANLPEPDLSSEYKSGLERYGKAAGIINTAMAWFKSIMSVARQNITLEVEDAPLVRTKTRQAGQQRTVRARVAIDFPKSDALKAVRAAGNLAALDLQVPDGGPAGGAKVVWRFREGATDTKYRTAKGGSTYRPDLAFVQFASGQPFTGTITNDDGETSIIIEGAPQRKNLSKNVRPYPRRAVVGVEVTLKVGNVVQDVNDIINTSSSGVVQGSLGFLADMMLRTSLFFQQGKSFEVTDWKEPAWEGEFSIIVNASGSKRQKAEKGGPETDYVWSLDRHVEGRLHTPEWGEIEEQENNYKNNARHMLEVDGDSRMFRLDDRSSARNAKSRNRYEANGPLQIQPPARNQLERLSRAEPSGSASLTFNGGFMTLELNPFFVAECMVARSESSSGRSANQSGPAMLSLLDALHPSTFTIIEPHDDKQDYIEGSKTFDGSGTLPYVPTFDATITIKYRLWKNEPPPPTVR